MEQQKVQKETLVRLTEDVVGEVTGRVIPKGSVGCVVELYDNPEGYAVDFDFPDAGDPTGSAIEFDTVTLRSEQFEIVHQANTRRSRSDRRGPPP